MTIHQRDLPHDTAMKGRHGLRLLDPTEWGSRLVVFTPTGTTIEDLLSRAARAIPGVAKLDVVLKVLSHNPDSLWAIARKSRHDAAHPEPEGLVALLMLNRDGLRALARGDFNGADPDTALLARQHERPAAIYTWAIHAPGLLIGGVPLVFEKVSAPLYRHADHYARAATEGGMRILQALGYRKGALIDGRFLPDLFHLPRKDGPDPNAPLCDSYHPSPFGSGLSVTVARSLEDYARVLAVRSATYIGEQECPYGEEFDGNDLCATHLIGYAGNEPAATLRIRYFADFAKMERVAVRKEFRKTAIVRHVLRAGIELCRLKGYRTIYGQPRTDLVRFYSHFGFRPMKDARTFRFSGLEFTEVVLETTPHPDAIRVGADPYLIIRPEGRWHSEGVLERSAIRGSNTIAWEAQP